MMTGDFGTMEIRQNYRSLASLISARTCQKEAISSQCEAGAVRALDSARRVLPAVNSTNVRRGIPIIFWRVRERS